ncbi:hypothetical protein FE904_19605 [Chryseobacterium indologenes]|uniref:TaqI family restriction endonuclease n=1 Tax=Chryseobacterium indologenes TaxID=253 RepID=UPI001109E54A|nr:TaqI family restriction endonuclease [Chryseobacterium indologenes]TLX23956.1 hypothetical protein FE904_19605 [Chryseobacterium indologenes]
MDFLLNKNTINVKRKLSLTSSALEDSLLSIKYSGEKLKKDKDVENTRFPPFVISFYYKVFLKNNIPTEDEFIELYYKLNRFKIEGEYILFQNKKLLKEGITARLLRTYPSLIRDLHFYLLLSESNLFDDVSYSSNTDYFKGLDLKIKYKGKEYFLSIHVGTERAKEYKSKKENRHDYSNIIQKIIKADFSKLKKLGDFYLFDNIHVNELITELENDNRE